MSVKKRVCFAAVVAIIIIILYYANSTGVNAAGDAGDTSPQYFGWWGRQREYPPNIITYFRI